MESIIELPPSRILAVETSGRLGSVAVALGKILLGERRFTHGMRHAVELMPTIRDLVAQQNWKPDEIDHIYVSTGPGSFTGLRISVAVARSLHQAIGCQLVAVPTLDVLARNAPAHVVNLVVVLDAKRGQVFAARYAKDANGILIRVAGPELVDPAAFVRATPRPVTVLGEGVEYHRAALRAGVDHDGDLIEIDKMFWPGTASAVHEIGWSMAQRGEFTPAEKLLPVYIRLPEAEELWLRRHPDIVTL